MIRSIIETSLVDWDGKLTTVLFFDKCNFMCPFCQNWELILHPERFPVIEWTRIETILLSKKSWIDGVVLTGGEPLAQTKEVLDIARRVKALDFLVKIDTNGAYPEILHEMIEQGLVDYVALDIKAPLDDSYDSAAGRKIDLAAIVRSISMLMRGQTDYEFRTTCVPSIINTRTIAEIGKRIQGAKRWFLQQYVPENAYKKEYRNFRQMPRSDVSEVIRIAQQYVTNTKWRGKETW